MLALSKRVPSSVIQVFTRCCVSSTDMVRPSHLLLHVGLLRTPQAELSSGTIGRDSSSSFQTACCGAGAGFRTYTTEKELKKSSETETGSESASQDASRGTTSRTREPTDFERRIFVWTGKYKTVEEVPSLVSEAALMNVKSKMRIYINIGMGAVTLVAAICMIVIGKSRSKKGDSLSKRNVDRHPEHYGVKTTE